MLQHSVHPASSPWSVMCRLFCVLFYHLLLSLSLGELESKSFGLVSCAPPWLMSEHKGAVAGLCLARCLSNPPRAGQVDRMQKWDFLLNHKYNIASHFPALRKATGISQCIPPQWKMNQSCTFLLPLLPSFSLPLSIEYPEEYSIQKSRKKKCCFQLQKPVHPWATTGHSALQLRSRHFHGLNSPPAPASLCTMVFCCHSTTQLIETGLSKGFLS